MGGALLAAATAAVAGWRELEGRDAALRAQIAELRASQEQVGWPYFWSGA